MPATTLRRLCAVSAVALITALMPATAPTADAASCNITWGSLTKASRTDTEQTVRNVRAGRHTCFDRVVIDLKGRTPTGYRVRYVDQVYQDGSGARVPLRGGAKLQVIVNAPAYDEDGRATYRPASRRNLVNVEGFKTLRQVAWAGSFEGQTTIGVGVRARLPFRVFKIDDGRTSRLVIDVAHRW